MKRYVLGDLHGSVKALQQVLKASNFNYDEDLLILLGDIADGYPDTAQCIEEIMKVKKLVWCLGNHDKWTQDWFLGKMDLSGFDGHDLTTLPPTKTGDQSHLWLSQGGLNTYKSYMKQPELISKHREFWTTKPILYYVTDNMCFVHAGWNRHIAIETASKTTPHILYWDRNMWSQAMSAGDSIKLVFEDNFDKVFIGHTSTNFWNSNKPLYKGGVWNVDTGCGWYGPLTIMDIDTEEYWQSDLGQVLYPDHKPRG